MCFINIYSLKVNYTTNKQFKMKILYDHQIFFIQIFGGISRYFQELSSQLDAKKNIRTEFETVDGVTSQYEFKGLIFIKKE